MVKFLVASSHITLGITDGYWNQYRNNLNRNGYIESEQILNNLDEEILSEFKLMSPYPNPFNPITQITYYVPKSSLVEIAIHDITGRKVEILEVELDISQKYIDDLLDTITKDLSIKKQTVLASLDSIISSLCLEIQFY